MPDLRRCCRASFKNLGHKFGTEFGTKIWDKQTNRQTGSYIELLQLNNVICKVVFHCIQKNCICNTISTQLMIYLSKFVGLRYTCCEKQHNLTKPLIELGIFGLYLTSTKSNKFTFAALKLVSSTLLKYPHNIP